MFFFCVKNTSVSGVVFSRYKKGGGGGGGRLRLERWRRTPPKSGGTRERQTKKDDDDAAFQSARSRRRTSRRAKRGRRRRRRRRGRRKTAKKERDTEKKERRKGKRRDRAWEETASKPGWNVESSPLSEEHVHNWRGTSSSKTSEDGVEICAVFGGREEGDFKSKNKAGVSFRGRTRGRCEEKDFSTSLSSSVFVKLFDERLYEKIKVSDEQCLKKETKALASFSLNRSRRWRYYQWGNGSQGRRIKICKKKVFASFEGTCKRT